MPTPRFTVCIPAAGGGSRMESGVPKQYLPILGVPMVARTSGVFAGMEECERIVLASDDPERLEQILRASGAWRDCRIVRGGAERRDSVLACLREVPEDAIALVHDAARPCVTPGEIRAVARAAARQGAALLALPARDTVKRVDAGGRVIETIPRGEIRLAQTPQGASARFLRSAYEAAAGEIGITDDMQVLERAGIPVFVVEGSPFNLKVTTPGDLLLAEAILRSRGA